MSALRIWITGRVQGVGFRFYTARAARDHGIVGKVRNRADGRVEIEAAGEPESLAAFIAELRRGPRGSWVEAVTQEPYDGAPDWKHFEIDRSSS